MGKIAVLEYRNAAGDLISAAGVAPYVWDYSSAEEWVQPDGVGGWAPATTNGTEMVLIPKYAGAPNSFICQTSPLTYPTAPMEGIAFAAQIRGECTLMPTTLWVNVALEYPSLGRAVMGRYEFGGSFDPVWLDTAVLLEPEPEPPVCKIWVGIRDVVDIAEYGFTVYVENSEVRDYDNNRLIVGAEPGYLPTGGSWVAETS